MAEDLMQMVRVFADQGHSGSSAAYAIGKLMRLLDWKPLTPLWGAEDEWQPSFVEGDLQQNIRCFAVFRTHGDNATAFYSEGKIFSDDGGQTWYTSRESHVPITFPFWVPSQSERILGPNGEDSLHT